MSFDWKTITSSYAVELLGVTLDKNINFKRHIQNICYTANNNTKALFRIRKFLNLEQEQVLAEPHISSNFRYCLMIWMFCGKMSDNLIVKTHYRALRAVIWYINTIIWRTTRFKWEKENSYTKPTNSDGWSK